MKCAGPSGAPERQIPADVAQRLPPLPADQLVLQRRSTAHSLPGEESASGPPGAAFLRRPRQRHVLAVRTDRRRHLSAAQGIPHDPPADPSPTQISSGRHPAFQRHPLRSVQYPALRRTLRTSGQTRLESGGCIHKCWRYVENMKRPFLFLFIYFFFVILFVVCSSSFSSSFGNRVENGTHEGEMRRTQRNRKRKTIDSWMKIGNP